MIPLLAPLRRRRAERALAAGRADRALRHYRRLADAPRAATQDRLRCAEILEMRGDRAGAIRLMDAWVQQAPTPDLRLRLAEALIRAGRHEDGARLWAALVHEGAVPADRLLQLGAAIADQGGEARAEGLFSDSFHGTDDPEVKRTAWRHYAAMAEAAGRHETALERWKLLAAFAEPEVDDWRHIGTLAARLGERETVREASDRLPDPDDRAALRQLLADGAGDWAGARRAASERLARALPEEEADLCRTLVRYAILAGDDRGAVHAFLDFRRRDRGAVGAEPTAVMQAAQALNRMGKPALAEAVLRAHLAARTAPDARLDILFAEILVARGRHARAAEILSGVAPEDPALSARHVRLRGHVAWAEGARQEAAGLFRDANRTRHATEASFLREIDAWRRLGETRERSLALRRALARFPRSLALCRQAALFAEEGSDWESAAAAWGHCAEIRPEDPAIASRHALALLEAGRPYHFLTLAERIAPEAGGGPPAAAPPGGGPAPFGSDKAGEAPAGFDRCLVAAYARLLRAPGADRSKDRATLAHLARTEAERAALERFAERARRGAEAHAVQAGRAGTEASGMPPQHTAAPRHAPGEGGDRAAHDAATGGGASASGAARAAAPSRTRGQAADGGAAWGETTGKRPDPPGNARTGQGIGA